MKKMADIMSKTGKWLLVFGFIFSQLSFPIEVLADELEENEDVNQEISVVVEDADGLVDPVNDIQTDEAVIKVNGIETTEYTIDENTEVIVVLEYQEETITEVLDFSKKLYGTYQYTFEAVDDTVTINYIGNNANLLKQYETVVDTTKKLTCDEVECVISGFGADLVSVADVTGYYNLTKFAEDYNASVVVSNEEGILVATDTVLNGYKLEIVDNQSEVVVENGVLVNTTTSTYTINRVGDVFIPSDGLIDVKDQEAVIDDILQGNELTSSNDVNGDGILNILDATHSTYMDGDVVEGEVTDILTNTLISTSDEILIGETVEVKLFISGFDKLSLYGIEGLLAYDETVLELVGAKLYVPATDALIDEETEDLGYLKDKKFAYVLKNGFNNTEEAILTLEFEAVGAGTSEICISDILESYGEAFELENNSASVSVTVTDPEDNKGGDEEELPGDTTTDDTITDDTTDEEEKEEESEVTKPVVRPVVLSSDYYIKSLVIDGYEIDFNMYTYDYSIKVGHDVNSLNFEVLLNDNNSIYYVEGNENFESGENLVYLVVKAENGSTRTYTIRVEKETEKEIAKEDNELDEGNLEEEEENNTSKTIIIVLIILVIIGLIYVIFKDDEEDKKAAKKSSQSEKTKSDNVKIEQVKLEKVKDTKKATNNKNTKKNSKRK